MKAREYAVSLGLAKPGKGKLSANAHAAIQKAIADGQTFSDYGVKNVSTNRGRNTANTGSGVSRNDSKSPRGTVSRQDEGPTTPQEIESRPVTHDYSTVWGIDTNLRRPVAIAYQFCSACFLQVKYCVHDIPQLPAYLGAGDAQLTKPTKEELNAAVPRAPAA